MPHVQNGERVGVIMGSDSDLPKLVPAAKILDILGIEYKFGIKSAHRTPEEMMDYSKNAHNLGIKAIIAAAGGSAHLPGMVSSETIVPVFGVGIAKELDWMDASVASSVRMPPGVPLSFVGINESGATNAALAAGRVIAQEDSDVREAYETYWANLQDEVRRKDALLGEIGPYEYTQLLKDVKAGSRDTVFSELKEQ